MKRKLLVVTPRFPFPPIGGDRMRIYQICRELSADCDLTLLSLCGTREEMKSLAAANAVFTSVHLVYHPLWKRALGVLEALPSPLPLQVGYYRNREFARRLRELAPLHDGVLAHLIRTGDYLRDFPGPKFLEMTDAISLAYARTSALRMRNFSRSLAYRIERPRLDRYEAGVVRDFDLVVFVSSIDRDYLMRGQDLSRTLICPVGVDLSAFPFSYTPDGRTVVFVGNLTSHQNLDAATYFAGSILPLIRARIPHARFKVIGRVAPRARRQLSRYAGVWITGVVDSVPDAALGASAGVCPIRFGAGMQTKLLEYMALGVPAVTSPIGLEGLNAVPDRHLLLADNPQRWAERICWLLEDGERGRSIALQARALVEGEYSCSATLAPLRKAITMQLDSRRTAA